MSLPTRRVGRETATGTTERRRRAIAAVLGLVLARDGRAADDCLAHWRIAGADAAPGHLVVVCRDGDPTCDTDAAADGTCTFEAAACVNAPGCVAAAAELRVRGRGGGAVARCTAELSLPLDGPACAQPAAVRVRAGRATRALWLAARSADGSRRDRDRLQLACRRAGAGGARALVVTTDFETGRLVTTGVATPGGARWLDARIHADAVVRIAGGMAFVLNRFLGDSVQRLDPARGFRTLYQCSTGAGSNPHDIAVLAPDKAYVTRYDRTQLWIVDPSARSCARLQRGAVDLEGFADADGLPEMSQMAIVGDRLFVSVQRLDRRRGFLPTGRSRLVVIDTASDTAVGEIVLPGSNAFGDSSGIVEEPGRGTLLLATPGDLYTVGDGGIVRVDPVALTAEPGFVIDELALGGNVTDFVVASPTKAYAVVQTASLQNRLAAFDPTGATPPRTLFSRQAFLPDIALAPDGTLWLADQSLEAPGVRRFSVATGAPLGGTIDLGLPPFSLGFVP